MRYVATLTEKMELPDTPAAWAETIAFLSSQLASLPVGGGPSQPGLPQETNASEISIIYTRWVIKVTDNIQNEQDTSKLRTSFFFFKKTNPFLVYFFFCYWCCFFLIFVSPQD